MYSDATGHKRVEVLLQGENVWLDQRRLAELFGVNIRTVSEHLRNIFDEGELAEQAVFRKFRNTGPDGKSYLVGFYDLDAIISVGYRVNSVQATQFRIWATRTLREFIVKGFVLDDERLKLNKRLGKDYFDELLERIRSIRASERRFYLKITDIYEECSIDYDKDAPTTQTFFKTVQNKLHWAVGGRTAAEIIAGRADAAKPNMGLTTWKSAPTGRIVKSDVSVAKNYLIEREIKELERIVGMYLDYAENQAARQIVMKMADWVQRLDAFLQFNEYDVLTGPGKVSHEVAKQLAEQQYEEFRASHDRKFESDFEREIKRIQQNAGTYPSSDVQPPRRIDEPGQTTRIGYLNRNEQENRGPLGLPGTDHGQGLYRMRCGHCGTEYAANGSDIFQRKCPQCQDGHPSTAGWKP